MSRHKREKSRPRSKEPRPSRGSKSDRGSKSSKYYVDEGDSRTDRSSRSSNSRYENGSIKSNRGSGREEGRRRNELKRITEVQNVKGNNWDTVPHERCRPTRDDRRENTSSGGIPKSALSTNVLSQIKSTGTVKKAVKTNKKPTAMNKFLSMGLFLSKKGSKQEKEGWESKESSSSMNSKNPKSLSTNNEGDTRTPPFRSYEGTERIGLQKADPRHGESIRTFNTFGGKKYRSNYPPPSPAGSVQTYTPGMTRENRSVDMGYGSRIHEKRPDSVDGKSWHQKDRIQDRFEESRKVGSREGNYGQTSQQRKIPSGSRYATREDAYSRKDDKGSGRYKTQRSWSPPTTDSSVAQRRQQFESSMKKKSEQYPTTTEKWNRDNTFNQKARRQENIFDGRGNEYPDESSETRRRREYREPIYSNSTSTTQWRQDYKSSQQREGIYYDTMKRPDHAEVGSRHNYYRDKESWRQDRTNYGRNDTFPNHPNHPNHHDNSDMGKGGSPMNNGSGSAHPLHRQDRHLENLNPPRISEKQGNHIPTTAPYHKINRSMEPSNDNVTHSFNPPPNYHNNDDVRNKVVGNVIKNPPLHQNNDMESRYSSRNNDFCATSPHSQYDNGYNNRATAPLHDSTREDSHYHMNRMAGRNEVHNAQRFDRHDSRVQQESQERKIGAPINTGSGHANANVNSNNLHYHQGGTTQTTNHQRNSGNNENFSSANYPGEREQFNDRQGYGDSHVTRPFPHAIQNPSGNAHQAQHNSYQNTSQHKEQYSYSMTSNTGREAFYPHSDNSHYGTVINAHEGFNGNETLPPSPGRGEMPVGSMKYGGGGDSGSYIENNHPAHHQINQWGGGGRPQREENENYAFSRISGNNEIASQYVDGRMDNSGSQPNMHINHKESATGPPSTYRNNEIESNRAHGIGMNPPGMVSKKPGKVSKSSMPGAGKPKSALSLSLLSDLKTDNKKFLNKSPGPPSPNQKQSNSNAIGSGGNPLLAQIKMGAQLKPPRADDKRIKQLETPARPISIMDEIKLAKPLKKVDSRNLQKKPIDERGKLSN